MGEIDQTDDCRLACLRTCVDRYLSQGDATIRNGVVSCHGGVRTAQHITSKLVMMIWHNKTCHVLSWNESSGPHDRITILTLNSKLCRTIKNHAHPSCCAKIFNETSPSKRKQSKALVCKPYHCLQDINVGGHHPTWTPTVSPSPPKKKTNGLSDPPFSEVWQPNSALIVEVVSGHFLGEISHNSTPIFVWSDPFHEVMKYISVWSDPFQVHEIRVRCELKSGRSPSLSNPPGKNSPRLQSPQTMTNPKKTNPDVSSSEYKQLQNSLTFLFLMIQLT